MKSTIIALLATTALAVPAFAANNAANQPQQPNMQQQQQQPTNQQQSQAKPQDQQQQAQNGNQPIQPNDLNRSEVTQMQQALNQQGFSAGKADGKLGPRTRQAVRKFDQKKGIQSQNGRPTEQTLAQLGVNQDQNGNQSQPNGNGSSQ